MNRTAGNISDTNAEEAAAEIINAGNDGSTEILLNVLRAGVDLLFLDDAEIADAKHRRQAAYAAAREAAIKRIR